MSAHEGEDRFSILEIAARKGVPLRGDCGGKGLCHKCRIRVEPAANMSQMGATEEKALSEVERASGFRLACLCRPLGPVTVHTPGYVLEEDMSLNKTKIDGPFVSHPAVIRIPIEGFDSRGTRDRATRDLRSNALEMAGLNKGPHPCSRSVRISALRALSEPCVREEGFTLVSHYKKGIISIKRGLRPGSAGMALDLGTTTICALLFDPDSKEVLFSSSVINPQVALGADLISRIAWAQKDPDSNRIIHEILIRALESLILTGLERTGLGPDDLDRLVVVGNTAMTHFFLGLNPASLGAYPFNPVISSPMEVFADEIGLASFPETLVHIMPTVSGFVGSDTVAGIINRDMDRSYDTIMLMDIGTNGELALAKEGKISATSCATGPAFEGARLSCGVRAVPGAINRIRIDPDSFQVSYGTVGDQQHDSPSGICGSGIVDAVAEMLRLGLIHRDGAMNPKMAPGLFSELGESLCFKVTGPSVRGNQIYISQKDIREIQLAKAAMATGVRLLMERGRIDKVDRLILTGAFGSAIDMENAARLGLIPDNIIARERESVENAAATGALQTLADRNCEARARELADRIEYLDIASHKDFQEIFIAETFFP